MSLSVSILPSTEQVCQRNYISKISKKSHFAQNTIFLHKFLCVLSVYMIKKGFFVIDTLTLILPNAINTLNCHLYICVNPELIPLHKGF